MPRGSMGPGRRKLVTIVVMLIVVLASLISTQMLFVEQAEINGSDWEDRNGWHVEDDHIIIDGDAEWIGWNKSLVRPVNITSGANLVIKDSHIDIPLERLIFSSEPGFSLFEDGRMEVINTTISVIKDPRLYKAMFDPYEFEISIPAAWRVVNLRGTGSIMEPSNPVLEFSVLMTEGEGYVVVAAQRTPDDELKPIFVVGPEDVKSMQWKDVRVSLASFIGSTPRVTVFIYDAVAKDVLISGLRITDDGDPIPGDIEMTGHPDKEGWSTGHLYDVMEIFRDWGWWINPLVDGAGDLTVVDSMVQASPGLDRKWQRYRPQSVGIEGQGPYATIQSAPFTGVVNVSGDLQVEGSTFSYVPISAWGLEVSITGSTFVGDCELVSIGCNPGSEVSVKASEFILHELEENQQRQSIDDITWLLAIERGDALATVEGCTFTGHGTGIGIHVNRGEPVIRDCIFSDLLVSLWVHETAPSMEWGRLDLTLEFDDSSQVHYLETHEVTLDFEGEGEPPPSDNEYTEWNAHHYYFIDGLPEIYLARYQTPHYLLISAPTFLVGPIFGENTVESMEIYIEPGWAGDMIVEIDPSIPSMTVVFADTGSKEPIHWARAYGSTDVGNASGILFQRLHLRIDHEHYLLSYLNVTLDGELIDRVDLVELGHNFTAFREDIYFNHTIPPGPHNLTFQVMGAYTHEWNLVELRTWSWLVYRIDGQPDEDVFAWVADGENHGIIMVDEGMKVRGLTYAPDPMPTIFSLDILTWKDSEVTIDQLDVLPSYFAHFNVVGNGTVNIRDLRIPFFESTIRNCTVVIERMTIGYSMMEVWNADLTINGGQVEEINIMAIDSSNIHVEALIGPTDISIWIQCVGSSLLLKDCSFNESLRAEVRVTVFYSHVEVRDCVFNGTPLDIRLFEGNNTLHVTGCDFKGERAYLFVLPSDDYSFEDIDLLDTIPVGGSIDGNVFEGPGTGIIFFPPYKEVLLGENTFVGEAKAYAFFRPNVTILGDTDEYSIVTTLDRFRIEASEWIDNRKFEEKWLNFLADVTNNLENMDDPGLVDVVVVQAYDRYSVRGSILSFHKIRVADPRPTVPFHEWNSMRNDIIQMLSKYDIREDIWES
jgi:hypothetical protein